MIKLGFDCRIWEIKHGARGDLTQRTVLRNIRRDILSGHVLGAMLAPPCRSWGSVESKAVQLRSVAEPWGRSDIQMTEAQSRTLAEDNRTMRSALRLIGWLDRLRLPWILEHPQASHIHWTKEFQKLRANSWTIECVLDQCRFGTAWRKRTRLVCSNVDPRALDILRLRCSGSGGRCSVSGRPHAHDQAGTSVAHKQARTGPPSAYPPRLNRALARALSDSARQDLTAAAFCGGRPRKRPPSPPVSEPVTLDLGVVYSSRASSL